MTKRIMPWRRRRDKEDGGTGGTRIGPGLGLAVLTAVVLTVILSVDLLPRSIPLHAGQVAPYAVRAPRKISYLSQAQTQEARDQAAQQVAPVMELDAARISTARNNLTALLQNITAARSSGASQPAARVQAIEGLTVPPLSAQTAERIVQMSDSQWSAVSAEAGRLLQEALNLPLTNEAAGEMRQTLALRVAPGFSAVDRSVIVELTGRFVQANLVENQDATQRARDDARNAVAPVIQTYERGQLIVSEGQIVSPAQEEALRALGLLNASLDWHAFAAAALLSCVLVGALAAYVWHVDRGLLMRDRRMILLVALVLVATAAAKMIVPGRPLWAYVFPLPAVSMLVAILMDARLGIVAGICLSVLLGWISGGALDVTTVALVGSIVGALATWRRDRLSAYFLAGAYVALAEILAYSAFFLSTRSSDWQSLGLTVFELAAGGMLSAILAVGSFAILGRVFGILTTIQLLELANPTQPLLRRLLLEAPGTYHHSIMVGNLAERAAEVIGADSLLVRVGAYYHDIGKLERPWAFIENQTDLPGNVHDTLDPLASAQMIAAHVPDGMALAEQDRLPLRVRDLIEQHHGTRPISFFFERAQAASREPLDPTPFVYPGPRPQSREAAILMLADSTEAAARAEGEHTREGIERLVDHIVRQRLEEGQFDDCNLTLKDLTAIKQSFVALLTGIYHLRIPYPATAKVGRPDLVERRA